MELNESESLRALEALMSEFFNSATSNERKREIEINLENFVQMKFAWKYCIYFMVHTDNMNVKMYALNVLETVINKQWMGIEPGEKMEIRNAVNQYLLANHTRVPTFIRNKLVKLVVDIGRSDWPHFYPDFFPSILGLAQQPDTALLGVILLQTVSEELASPREDLPMSRRDELRRLLLHHVPAILELLNSMLESVLEKNSHLVAATPPPSPTQQPKNQRNTPVPIFSSSPIRQDTLLSSMFLSPVRGVHQEALPPLDEESKLLCSSVLTCLAHYFSWAPLEATLTPRLLTTIFKFAAFGCEGKGVRATSSAGTPASAPNLGVLSMNCINEVLSKNFVPTEFENFVLEMFQQTFHLLKRLTKESSTNATGNRLEELEEDYMERFTDFLRLFVGIHLRRFESNPNFPVLDFLSLLFKYTFQQPNAEGFFRCLDIWITFLDYLSTQLQKRDADMDSILHKYRDALKSLVAIVLQKVMFRNNQTQLEELDDDSLDDDGETEWQHFLRQCLEVVAKVAELIIADTFEYIWKDFNELVEKYFGLEKYITEDVHGRRLTMTRENECRLLHCMLRDLSSLLQALGRLADHFIGEQFFDRYQNSLQLMERLVQVVAFGSKMKLFEVLTSTENVLQQDFVQVHAQAMAAVKAYAHWFLQLYTESMRTNLEKEKFSNMIISLVDSVSPLINKHVPEKVAHSAAHLLLSIMTTIRPAFLCQLPAVKTMYTAFAQGSCQGLSIEIQLLVYKSLSHHLLLPWPGLAEKEQDWDSRHLEHQNFTSQLAKEYFALTFALQTPLQKEQAKPIVRRVLCICKDWVESVAGEVVRTKQMLYSSLSSTPVISTTLTIFPMFIGQTDTVDDIMGFFLALFQGLRVQMGVSFTEETMRTFMDLFTRQQIAQTIEQDTGVAVRVIEKFLKMLELIVVEPGSAFKRFLPRILDIALRQIYPLIAARPSPDIKSSLFELLHTLVVNNWRYFFPTNVLTSLQKQGAEVVEHVQDFLDIFQAYGESFLQPDITVFKQNLASLETLHYKWKLYNKEMFKAKLLGDFLRVLMQVLVHKSHDLLQEEIVAGIYNMAQVDFGVFHSQFLPHFLSEMDGLDNTQREVLAKNFKLEEDLPSFTQSVQRLTNDIRFYRVMNSSLSSGAIPF